MGPKPTAKKTISLSNAVIQGDNKSTNQEIDLTKQNEEYIANLLDKKTVLNSEVGKVDPDATTEVDFTKQEHVDKFTTSKSKPSTNTTADDFFANKSVDQIQAQLKAEEEKSKNVSPETFVEIARFIIFLIDASAAAFFKWWSGDAHDSQYSLSKPKQEQLVRQLATILIKYQAKFSIEFMFLISVLILYIPAFTMAKGNRKDNRAKKPTPTPTPKQQTFSTPVVEMKAKKPTVVYESAPIIEETKNPIIEEQHLTVIETPIVEEMVIAKPTKRTTRPKKAG